MWDYIKRKKAVISEIAECVTCNKRGIDEVKSFLKSLGTAHKKQVRLPQQIRLLAERDGENVLIETTDSRVFAGRLRILTDTTLHVFDGERVWHLKTEEIETIEPI